MATMKQIEKQIATANKNIAALQKRVTMYTERLDKAITVLNKKGADITMDDIITKHVNGELHTYLLYKLTAFNFDEKHRVLTNFDFKIKNEKDLQREVARLNVLTEELNQISLTKKEHDEKTEGLKNILENAMSDFRVTWFNTMREWYATHYNHINDVLPTAKLRKQRANKASEYFMVKRGWMKYKCSFISKVLDKVLSTASKVIGDDAARMDYDSYMQKKESELVDSWNYGIALLTEKCSKFCLNESAITVSNPQMTSKGFSVLISDNTSKVVDVRVIWAAEYSVLVTPHTRYIATQRSL